MRELLGILNNRKLGVTAEAATAVGTGIVELSWPLAAVCCRYVLF